MQSWTDVVQSTEDSDYCFTSIVGPAAYHGRSPINNLGVGITTSLLLDADRPRPTEGVLKNLGFLQPCDRPEIRDAPTVT